MATLVIVTMLLIMEIHFLVARGAETIEWVEYEDEMYMNE